MKKKKMLGRIVLVLFAVIVIAIFLAFTYINTIAQKAVETVGSSALGVPVTLESADISIFGGSVALKNLEVGNPEGFKTEKLFKLGGCSTKVDINSLTSDTIVVNDVTVTDLEITFEQKGMTSNLQALLDQLSAKSDGQEEEAETTDQEKKTEEETGAEEPAASKKLQLDRFHIEGAKVHVKLLPLPGQRSDITVAMEPFTIENVSSDSDKGQLAGVVVRKVFVAISQAVIKTIAQDIPAALLEGLQGSVDQAAKVIGAGAEALLKGVGQIGELGVGAAGAVVEGAGKTLEATGKGLGEVGKGTVDQLENAGKGLEKGVKDIGKGVGDLGKGIGDGLGGLLGGKKKKDEEKEE